MSEAQSPSCLKLLAKYPMIKNIVIIVLIVCVLALARTVIRLENYHYASVVGVCSEYKADDYLKSAQRQKCLNSTETRTNPLWHLFYALTD
jgi:hypothetical protein